mmetsp:Transcript_8753/g.23626  ORF Transcript_8753/g.23626 Transcript_8753/m.23626 type:complete len:208 (-) Transcript_8753:1124-1747(-)
MLYLVLVLRSVDLYRVGLQRVLIHPQHSCKAFQLFVCLEEHGAILHPLHDGNILRHVTQRGGSRQRRGVSQRHEESIHVRLRRQAFGLGPLFDFVSREGIFVDGEGPEGLVLDPMLLAECAQLGVEVGLRVEAILQDLWLVLRDFVQPLEVLGIVTVGDSELLHHAIVHGLFHRAPSLEGVIAVFVGTVQHPGIEIVGVEVLQRRLQ